MTLNWHNFPRTNNITTLNIVLDHQNRPVGFLWWYTKLYKADLWIHSYKGLLLHPSFMAQLIQSSLHPSFMDPITHRLTTSILYGPTHPKFRYTHPLWTHSSKDSLHPSFMGLLIQRFATSTLYMDSFIQSSFLHPSFMGPLIQRFAISILYGPTQRLVPYIHPLISLKSLQGSHFHPWIITHYDHKCSPFCRPYHKINFAHENIYIWIQISLRFVLKRPIKKCVSSHLWRSSHYLNQRLPTLLTNTCIGRLWCVNWPILSMTWCKTVVPPLLMHCS